MITIKDIAEQLGVSASTVARALGDHPRISLGTKERVRAAAAGLGYVAHAGARTMRGQASNLVGLIVPDIQNEFYSTVAAAISDTCDESGYQLLLSVTDDKPAVELRQVRGLFGARVAGVVLVASANPEPETIALLRRIPHVQLVRKCKDLKSDWFGIDDEAAMFEAATHLLKLGHRRIGFIGGSPALSTGSARLRGFRRAYQEVGASIADATIETGGGDTDYGKQALLRLLQATPKPTAVIAANSRMTLGMVHGLAATHVAVPGELSVVGFNDSPSMVWWGPGLTTIGLPVRELALSCSTLLLRRIRAINGREEMHAERPFSVSHTPFLIERGSTGVPRAD